MTHKLILKVKKFQLCGAKRFGIVEENLQGWWILPPPPPPYNLWLKDDLACIKKSMSSFSSEKFLSRGTYTSPI